MADFKTAYNLMIDHEAGYAANLGDGAGETYRGITRVNYPKWPGWKIIDDIKRRSGPIKYNTVFVSGPLPALVEQFYYENFWTKIVQGDAILNQDTANLVLDWAVNSQYAAVREINEAVARIAGNGTLKASKTSLTSSIVNVMNIMERSAYRAIWRARKEFYDNLAKKPAKKRFYNTWIQRLQSFPSDTVVRYIAPPYVREAATAVVKASSWWDSLLNFK